MASTPTNSLSAVVPKLLAQGLMSLREAVVMPSLVNLGYSEMAGEKGSTIEVPIPSAITATEVEHANIAPNPGALSPTSISIPMDQWFEAAFTLSDKELLEVQAGTIPMQASAAIRALANKVDNYIYDLWYKVPYQVFSVTNDTPFDPSTYGASDARTKGMTDVSNIMTSLNAQLAPVEDRRFVVDPIGYGNLVQMRAFQDMSWSGSAAAILDGKVSRKLGFDWFMTQNLPRSYAVGGGFTGGDATATVNAAAAAGANSVTAITGAGESIDLKKGDVITFSAANAGVYTVTADVAFAATVANTVSIYPNLRVPLTTSHTMTIAVQPVATPAGRSIVSPEKVLLAFHRDAFAFASRPLAAIVDDGLGSLVQSVVDPESGLSLRLEVTREYRRTRFAFDILFGAQLVRPEYATRYIY